MNTVLPPEVEELARSIMDRKPERVLLIKNPGRVNEECMPVLLNPDALNETIQVEWVKLGPLGLDHEVPHYARTNSIELPLTFFVSAFALGRQPNANQAQFVDALENPVIPLSRLSQQSVDFVNFMRSLCFPTRAGLRPPPVKIVWGKLLELVGVVQQLSFDYLRFDKTLMPIAYSATTTILETRVTRRYSEDVRDRGLQPDPEFQTDNTVPSQ